MINFVFEDFKNFRNFIKCKDNNTSGLPRFGVSPLFLEIHQIYKNRVKILTNPPENEKYIIPSSVAHSPDFWTGSDPKTPSNKTIFDFLNKKYLKNIKNKQAFILLDQSHEGYQELWLWKWFHDECKKYQIPASQVIYVTGNLIAEEQYIDWCAKNNIDNKMNVIPYAHFEIAMSVTANENLPKVSDHLKYKKLNSNLIKSYNCLQKRPRAHRAWLFKGLSDNNLLNLGFNSMNKFEFNKIFYDQKSITHDEFKILDSLLPILPPGENKKSLKKFRSQDCGNYLMKFNKDIMLDSWITVISEASFSDSSNTCFISEKTFKPIACCHPFIIYGNKHSLKFLKKMGYETFNPYINESYDGLSTWDRYHAIVDEIKRWSFLSEKDKRKNFKKMAPILEHNRKVLFERKHKTPVDILSKLCLND